LFAGGKFTLASHPCASEQGKTYVVTAIDHVAGNPTHVARGDVEMKGYENSFTCIPDAVVFRPARLTPKPVIRGMQTAIVVGPGGEEIHTDKYGRIKVQFHWDRRGGKDDRSSCWIRVAQNVAGRNWGASILPRIGQEVVVAFLEGDPDRPLVVGSVYNADQMPPYELPANKTQSGLKSRSSKGGGGANFNEIRLEDKAGAEQVYMHAERNLDTVAEKDETHNVGVDRTKTIGRDEKTTIGQDRMEKVGRNEVITIGANRTETVGANETITIALTRTEAVGVNEAVVIGGAREHNIGGAELLTVGLARKKVVGVNESSDIGNNRSADVGKNDSTKIGGNQDTNVADDRSLTVGKNRTQSIGKDDSLSVGKNLTITAGDQITIKTGSASIVMKKNGDITINGKQITIKGSGDVIIKGKKILEN
jgi:type VI secretion system secreted protein VgrG